MKLTFKGDYAVKTILDLSVHYGQYPVTIPDLARRSDIPIKFLEQILLDLKRGGFVESRRGKIGGYLLAKHPSKITVGDVVRFIEGPLEPIECVQDGYKGCRDLKKCVLREVWCKVGKAITGVVDAVTFEELVKKSKKFDAAYMYQI
ncbi:MAG: Rrf2 family transcriptional regulator [Candidatus Omnitrophota bacterium]|jgi:Rrf2 family protein